jgi:serpin B
MEYSTEIASHLKSIGMSHIFRAGSFPELTDPDDLFISAIIHKTFLEVNEKGAEAAAVTAIHMKALARVQVRTFVMKVDRPFLFTIHDNVTGLVMFIGHIDSISS